MSIALLVFVGRNLSDKVRIGIRVELSMSVYYPVMVPMKLIDVVNRQEGAVLFVLGRAIAKAKLAFPL